MKKRTMLVGECEDYLAVLKKRKIKPGEYLPAQRAIRLLSQAPKHTLKLVIGEPVVGENRCLRDDVETARIRSDFRFKAERDEHPRKCKCGCGGKGIIILSITRLFFLRLRPHSKYPRCYPVPERPVVSRS